MKTKNDKLRDDALKAITVYLDDSGWTTDGDIQSKGFLMRIDPITGMVHRTDFAFFIQTERQLTKLLTEKGSFA